MDRRPIADALGRPLEVARWPRIVSLVPSLTELVFDLGAGDRLIGCTRYCTEPVDGLAGVARVGGQKDPDVDAILALAPDLVLAVEEENLERDVERLSAAGVPVYVANVRTVEDAVALIGEIGDAIDADPSRAQPLIEAVRAGVIAARRSPTAHSPTVFCPVWRDPWITISQGTYAWDALVLVGARPLALATRQTKDRRYPKVELAAVIAARPDVVLLLDEPFPFAERDVAELKALLPATRVVRCDGKALLWYGHRTGELASLAQRLSPLAAAD